MFKSNSKLNFLFLAASLICFECVEFKSNLINVQRSPRSVDSTFLREKAFNYINYLEIKNQLQTFPSAYQIENDLSLSEIVDFKEMAIDAENQAIYIGAKNFLIKLSFENNTLQMKNVKEDLFKWEVSSDVLGECKRARTRDSDKYCHNYVRLIALTDRNDLSDEKIKHSSEETAFSNRLLVCGTYAEKPLCNWHDRHQITNVMDTFDGLGKISQTPDSSLSYVHLSNGDLYVATSIDYSSLNMKNDHFISRTLGMSSELRTDQYNSNWLNDPTFVASFTIGNYVYFFLKETALESMSCGGQKTYSRVVRLCKYDQGIEHINIWKRFEKARLNCTVSNMQSNSQQNNNYEHLDNPHMESFEFNELQDVFYDKRRNLIYTLFTTRINEAKLSAVCIYDIQSIEKAFSGPFKYQKSMESVWQPYEEESLEKIKCEPNMNSSINANKFQLKDQSVQPILDRPVLVASNRRLTKLVVDSINDIDVLFMATDSNTILKYMILNKELSRLTSNLPIACHLEEIELFNVESKQNLINNMALIESRKSSSKQSERSVLIATSSNVIKMPLALCDTKTTHFSCLTSMNPYCFWDSKIEKCVSIFALSEFTNDLSVSTVLKQNPNLHQNQIDSCPSLNVPIDGGFSEWSNWKPCLTQSSERCLCRSRLCNSPEPRNGGKSCDDNLSIEIANCQVDGSWTEWSAWSACQGSCDSAQRVRTRTRSCTNPAPKNNGRLCIGHDHEEETCTQEMLNPCMSKNQNQWFAWGAWTQCSKSCGEGFQMRKRVCNGKNCVGCNQEWQTCNSEPCQGKNETGKWELVEANAFSKQSLEKRFKFSCKVDSNSDLAPNEELQVNITSEYKLCDNLNASCKTFENIEELAYLTDWSEWSKCNESNKKQIRTRKCSDKNKLCFGHLKESRECLTRTESNQRSEEIKKTSEHFSLIHVLIVSSLAFLIGLLIGLAVVMCLNSKQNAKKSQRELETPSKRVNKKHSSPYKQNSSGTVFTDVYQLNNLECSKLRANSIPSNDSADSSSSSNQSKEYFTIGNRFDKTCLSPLLNNNLQDEINESQTMILNTNKKDLSTLHMAMNKYSTLRHQQQSKNSNTTIIRTNLNEEL